MGRAPMEQLQPARENEWRGRICGGGIAWWELPLAQPYMVRSNALLPRARPVERMNPYGRPTTSNASEQTRANTLTIATKGLMNLHGYSISKNNTYTMCFVFFIEFNKYVMRLVSSF